MQTSDEGTLTLLQSLLRVAQDSAEGYATAERDMPEPDLLNELEQRHKQRVKIVEELQTRIRDLRVDPDAGPTAFGEIHRKWIHVKSGNAANPAEAVMTEMERSEDIAVDAFRQALGSSGVDATTRKMLQRHYESVQSAHARIKQLRDRSTLARE